MQHSDPESVPLHVDLPYADPAHERQCLDVYVPRNAANQPVVFWIHGGGWQTGDKSEVSGMPAWFATQGFVFVSINHRFLPEVDMDTLYGDVASALGWVVRHIDDFGGDAGRILLGGHSSGAQLAALHCTDHRRLRSEGVEFERFIGCLPVDGDTYDVPAIIETAETRRRVHGLPQVGYGHRQKFGNDPAKHRDFSPVHHITPGKSIPPFFILHDARNPDTTAQACRLEAMLGQAEIPATRFGAKDTNHIRIKNELGRPGDEATIALTTFLDFVCRANNTGCDSANHTPQHGRG